MTAQRVAVLFGGRSGEHEVSVVSARSVMDALDRERWEVVPIGLDRHGGWLTPAKTQEALDAGSVALEGGSPMLQAPDALEALAGCDLAFPLIHGTYGEDGTMQGFLEMAGLPYAGAGVAASGIGMDKALMKALFRDAGIPVLRYAVLHRWDLEEDEAAAAAFVAETTGYPCFVKPANGGSSVGVSKARSREDLSTALQVAFAYDDKAVIEEAVEAQEVEVSVLGNERPEASIVGEIAPDREFYDYESKYSAGSSTSLHIPARLPEAAAERVRELAVRMYQVMGCEGYARVDFFVREGTDVIANEVNTIPGFTSISMYPKLWEATGLGYQALLTRILELALQRHERRARR
ncbi:MAG: D-alanine--D-alanine ligase family protein [Dehalococcoidia bacterium]|nr:D-alanine--D-alanine ligase family protein [Dehalococcoidia bacterium]